MPAVFSDLVLEENPSLEVTNSDNLVWGSEAVSNRWLQHHIPPRVALGFIGATIQDF